MIKNVHNIDRTRTKVDHQGEYFIHLGEVKVGPQDKISIRKIKQHFTLEVEMSEYNHLGVDVSHHQYVNQFNWDTFTSQCEFLIARCSYGARADRRFREFRNACKGIGVVFGTYHFFRQKQAVERQIVFIERELDSVEYGEGDLYPALDLEANERWDGKAIADLYNDRGRQIAEWIATKYGKCLIYISPAFWKFLGSPRWILDHEIWTSHWDVEVPDKIGDKTEHVWQYDVIEKEFYHDGPIDVNWCRNLNKLIINSSNEDDSESIRSRLVSLREKMNNLHAQSAELCERSIKLVLEAEDTKTQFDDILNGNG